MKLPVFKVLILLVFSILISCKEDVLPKPKGHLRLEYPLAKYKNLETDCSFQFEVNQFGKLKNNNCSFEINYPKMKATIYITHKKVNNNIKNLLQDAQKLTYEHAIKADDITEQPYINKEKNVYGMFYRVGGNAATNTQFYVTDSTKNFITGSVYFYAKPNYDSILPAANYLQNDIRHLMETIKWK